MLPNPRYLRYTGPFHWQSLVNIPNRLSAAESDKIYILSVNDYFQALQTRKSFTDLITADRHLQIFCLDLPTQDLLVHMRRVCDIIEESLSHGRVLVHYVHGISRSTTFVITYLMRRQHSPLAAVLTDVRQKRPQVKPSKNFLAQLEVWDQVGYNNWEDEDVKVPKALYVSLLEERGLTDKLPAKAADLDDWYLSCSLELMVRRLVHLAINLGLRSHISEL